ncbi:MAG: DUF373 family protein [Candidatus Diapherotrites archaeon]|nr:DUF373 family protein [Candidatus Diapherotrites archaeon]
MARKVLVLCVDRDDDLGKKAKISGPVIGEKENLEAAQALALADPTESDVNAIFAAVKAFQELRKEKEDAIVATLTGHFSREWKADKIVAEQLDAILKKEGVTDVILVSDGADDQQVLPLVESRVKVAGVRTVIVKQAKELEKSYYVIKEVLRDPHFARLVFGLPGIVLALYGMVKLLGIENVSVNIVLGLLGVYLIMKGFGIEDALARAFTSFKKSTSIERASFPLYIAAVLVLLLGFWSGVDNIYFIEKGIPADVVIDGAHKLLVSFASFLAGFAGLFMVASVLFMAGRMGDVYYKKEVHKIRRYARYSVSMVALYVLLDQIARFVLFWSGAVSTGPLFADLFVAVGTSFLVVVVGYLFIRYLYVTRYVMRRIQKDMPVKDVDGKDLGRVLKIDYKKKAFLYSGGEKGTMSERFGRVVLISDAVVIG